MISSNKCYSKIFISEDTVFCYWNNQTMHTQTYSWTMTFTLTKYILDNPDQYIAERLATKRTSETSFGTTSREMIAIH